MQDRNFIVFIALSAIILMVWIMFFAPKPEQKPGGDVQPGSTVAAGSTAQGSTVTGSTTPGSTIPVVPGSTTPADAAVPPDGSVPEPEKPAAQVQLGETVTVKTDYYDIVFNTVGAAPSKWELMEYSVEKCHEYRIDIKWPPLVKDPPCDRSPVDLLSEKRTGGGLNSLIAQVTLGNTVVKVGREWTADKKSLDLTGGAKSGELVFSLPVSEGVTLKKVYRFEKASYAIGLTYRLEGAPVPAKSHVDEALFYRFDPVAKSGVPRWNYNGLLGFQQSEEGKGLKKLDADDLLDDGRMDVSGMEWVGMTDDYFLFAVLANADDRLDFRALSIATEEQKNNKKSPKDLVGWVHSTPSAEEIASGVVSDTTLYVGPKNRRILTPVRESLSYSIDYGRLGLLVYPLIEGIYYINTVVGNYGVSIIILTFILRMAMFPLTRTSQRSMKQMQKLQPEMKKIREMYADDKMKQNEEMQSLMRKNKINPAMGCIPILLQFPVFFAFYKALLISIELRHAPFMLWITDLSARDPYYVWPVLMGATQLVTQRLTPTQVDPMQQKIFLAMPIVFMYILRDFPSGLLIYWTIQNLVGIGQQVYVNRQPD